MKILLLTTLILTFLSTSCSKNESQTYLFSFPATTEELKYCFIGDTGTGHPIQSIVAKELQKENCHSIHFLGDIIYPRGLSSSKDPQFHDKFSRLYAPLSESGHHPKLNLVMGNHDRQRSYAVWKKLAKKNPYIFFPEAFYLIRNHDLCLIHLETNVFKILYDLGHALDEFLWLTSIQKELEQCQTTIALGHHPYNSSGPHHGNSSGFIRFFLEHQVLGKFNYFIAGHEHILSDEGMINGTRLLISGAGGHPDKNQTAGYLVMKMKQKDGKIKVESYEFKKVSLPK